ncbi:hypothetical protein O0I10_012338 [Lichtheimia ornata]|uniref:C2H2-type domain-containing protein n=1 Tax=Lichtheimia ornata TaxID=688661 RepID=A0AAD7UST6_9FUNG|nr:uncharacterized protein O0I10_012338 [Lichtheimia ornata]KAJ8652064.1 hypothetical protein O0I10_012338 [Lichtheimia ornata]
MPPSSQKNSTTTTTTSCFDNANQSATEPVASTKVDLKEEQESTTQVTMPTDDTVSERMTQIDDLKYFLATAPDNNSNVGWQVVETNSSIKRFRLPVVNEDISCVLWDDFFFMTGTDIVRSLTFRFHAFGRPVTNAKKFEEGIFSDLRNLKPGMDARLEDPKSDLLDLLYRHNCIRTQKKQKVFFWFSVPHDRLFLDALQRDLKREKLDMEPATTAVAEPATSISLDSSMDLFDKLRKAMAQAAAAEDTTSTSTHVDSSTGCIGNDCTPTRFNDNDQQEHGVRRHGSTVLTARASGNGRIVKPIPASRRMTEADLSKKRALFGALELFDGSPMYKQRRRRHRSASTAFHAAASSSSSSASSPLAMMETPHHWRSTTTPCDWMMEQPRAYTCPHCGNPFQQLELLDAHLRSHEREQPFVCCLCGKRFVCQYGLAEHQHVFHPFDSCCCCCCSWSPDAAPIPHPQPQQPPSAVAAAVTTPMLDEDASSLVTSPCTPTSLFTPYMDPCWSASVATLANNNKSAEYPNMWFTSTTDDWMLQQNDLLVSSSHQEEQQQEEQQYLPPSQTSPPAMVSADWSIPLL